MIAQAMARIAAFFDRSAAPRRSSSDVRGSGASSHRPAFLAAPLATAFLLALVAAPASAAAVHPLKETFGSAAQSTFTEAQGIAVDQSNGDLLVSDKFDST